MPDFTRISADRSGEQQRSEPRPEWDEEHRRRIAEPDRSRWSPVVAKRLEQTYEEVADGKSRHEAARSATQMLARYEDEGEVGASAAIEELHVEFVKAKTVIEPRYDLRTVEGDWKRMLDGARENVAATEFDGHRPPKPADLVGEKTERPSWVLPEEFWRRPVLAHVRQAAQACRRAPAAVLGAWCWPEWRCRCPTPSSCPPSSERPVPCVSSACSSPRPGVEEFIQRHRRGAASCRREPAWQRRRAGRTVV